MVTTKLLLHTTARLPKAKSEQISRAVVTLRRCNNLTWCSGPILLFEFLPTAKSYHSTQKSITPSRHFFTSSVLTSGYKSNNVRYLHTRIHPEPPPGLAWDLGRTCSLAPGLSILNSSALPRVRDEDCLCYYYSTEGRKNHKHYDHSFTTSVRERSRTRAVQQAMSIA